MPHTDNLETAFDPKIKVKNHRIWQWHRSALRLFKVVSCVPDKPAYLELRESGSSGNIRRLAKVCGIVFEHEHEGHGGPGGVSGDSLRYQSARFWHVSTGAVPPRSWAAANAKDGLSNSLLGTDIAEHVQLLIVLSAQTISLAGSAVEIRECCNSQPASSESQIAGGALFGGECMLLGQRAAVIPATALWHEPA